jgi:hypothetical protein
MSINHKFLRIRQKYPQKESGEIKKGQHNFPHIRSTNMPSFDWWVCFSITQIFLPIFVIPLLPSLHSLPLCIVLYFLPSIQTSLLFFPVFAILVLFVSLYFFPYFLFTSLSFIINPYFVCLPLPNLCLILFLSPFRSFLLLLPLWRSRQL